MRRALRPLLPALAFLYGLHWDDIERMPPPEIEAHVEQVEMFMKVSGAEIKQQ